MSDTDHTDQVMEPPLKVMKTVKNFKKLILKIQHDTKLFSMSVENFCSVGTVKRMISDKFNYDSKIQELTYDGKVVQDDEKLMDLNTEKQQTMHFTLKLTVMVEITILSQAVSFHCKINCLMRIKDFKVGLSSKLNIPSAKQYVIFNKQILDETKNFVDYNVTNGSVIEILLKLVPT